MGQLPVLKVDGKMVCQSNAIANYCAKLAGFTNLSDMEQLDNDMVCETVKDIFEASVPPAFMARNAIPESG